MCLGLGSSKDPSGNGCCVDPRRPVVNCQSQKITLDKKKYGPKEPEAILTFHAFFFALRRRRESEM